MRDLESSIVQHGIELLKSNAKRLAANGITWREPDIKIWQLEAQHYTSEIRVMILKDGKINDVLEFHIYRDGKPMVTTVEATNWFKEQLEQLIDE
jgi:hypothetical protein